VTGVGLAGAFLGGLASLLSPCSALLLPSFFAYAFDRLGLLIRRTVAFWAGLCLVLVPLGAGVGAVGDAVTRHRTEVTVIGGIVVLGFGVMTLIGKGFGSSAAQRLTGRITISTTVSVVALGAVYGLAGFCAGPLLGGVLTMSAMGADPLYGGLLMGVYAVGMAAPLFGLAFLWERYDLGRKGWLRGRPVQIGPLHTHTTSLVTGTVLILIGALFVATDGTAALGGVLGVDQQYDLQIWLSRVAAGAADPVVLLAVVVGLIAWRSTIVLRRRARSPEPDRQTTSG
jgi:cytochrome c biogenesis protein CcdA